jgi:hypothetical protein
LLFPQRIYFPLFAFAEGYNHELTSLFHIRNLVKALAYFRRNKLRTRRTWLVECQVINLGSLQTLLSLLCFFRYFK